MFVSWRTTHHRQLAANINIIYIYMDVSENSGTPQSSIWIGFSIINHPFWGTPIFGNTHIYIYIHWQNLGPLLKVFTFRLKPSWTSKKKEHLKILEICCAHISYPNPNVHIVWAKPLGPPDMVLQKYCLSLSNRTFAIIKSTIFCGLVLEKRFHYKSNIETTLLKTNIAPKNGGFQ